MPRKCCYQICNFFLLQLIILLLGTQDLGWRRKFKLRVHFLWARMLLLLLGAHLSPRPTALLSVPSFAGPEEFIPLAKKSKLLTVLVIYSFILWTWSGVTVKGDEGIEIHPSSRPQGHENTSGSVYKRDHMAGEALLPLNHVHSGTSSNVLICPVSTCTHFENQCTGQTRNAFL